MAVALWWKERLAERHPIGLEGLRIEGYNVKPSHQQDTWPRAVARQALFEDYKAWFERVFLPPYQNTDYYKDFPEQLPVPVEEIQFFMTLGPWLYVLDKKKMVRNYLVTSPPRQYEGKWVQVKVNRYFVRLCDWNAHVAIFELQTGIDVTSSLPAFNSAKVELVARAAHSTMKQIAKNRAALPPAVGNHDKT